MEQPSSIPTDDVAVGDPKDISVSAFVPEEIPKDESRTCGGDRTEELEKSFKEVEQFISHLISEESETRKKTTGLEDVFAELVKKWPDFGIANIFTQPVKSVEVKGYRHTDKVDIDYRYAIIQEVNESETEAWQYFLRWEGNEEEIQYLHKTIQSIDWIPIEECSIFYSNIDDLVSEQTAKEMSRLDFGSKWRNRKFDGKLEHINFGFKKRDRTIEKMNKIFDHIGYGQIEDYIGDEDYSGDSDDRSDDSDDQDEDDDSSDSSEEETETEKGETEKEDKQSSESESSESESEKDKTTPPARSQGIPPSLLSKNGPSFSKHRRK